MVRKIRIVILLLIMIAAAIGAWYFFADTESDEAHLRRVLSEIVLNITKRDGDGTTSNLIHSKALPGYFTSPCHVSLGGYVDSGDFTSESITNNSMRIRSMFRSLSPAIKDLYLEIAPDGKTATADFAASIRGVLNNGEEAEGIRDLRCKMVKQDGKWKVGAVNIREVLEK